jgi:hypothetical protein
MGWFTNDKDPDNILKEVTSFVDKFQSIVDRCASETVEWDNREQKALDEYNKKKAECDSARGKLDKASAMASKMLSVFD